MMMTRQSILKIGRQIAPSISKPPSDLKYKLFFDGCSKGNPGLAGAGAVIYDSENKEIWSGNNFVGEKATNNQCTYHNYFWIF